jgi:hypothetical protein
MKAITRRLRRLEESLRSWTRRSSNISDRRLRNNRPKMYSLYSDASICDRSLSADLKRKVSSCLSVILVRRTSSNP